MVWQIETALQADYLIVRVLGNADTQVVGDIVAGIFRAVEAHDHSKLFLDIRDLKGRPGVLDTFHMVSNYPSTKRLCTAIVDLPENRNWFEFYETVSVNRGYHNKVFTDVEQAREWLMG